MLTSKQRAYLRSLGNTYSPILHVGKSGLSDAILKQADDALTARELLKARVLNTAPTDGDIRPAQNTKQVAAFIAAGVNAEVVCTAGNCFILYRARTENPTIRLPR